MTSKASKATQHRMTVLADDAEQIKQRVEEAWRESEHAVASMWHQSAIAALHWVSSHRSRVAGFRQAVKDTPMEKALDVALKTLRAEARTPLVRTRKATRRSAARPAAVRRGAAKKRAAR
jgi:hypothetical protein